MSRNIPLPNKQRLGKEKDTFPIATLELWILQRRACPAFQGITSPRPFDLTKIFSWIFQDQLYGFFISFRTPHLFVIEGLVGICWKNTIGVVMVLQPR